jgi:type IV pilus assembly protein PilF
VNTKALVVLAGAALLTTLGCASNQGIKQDMSQHDQAAQYNLELAADYYRQGNLAAAKEKIDKSLDQNSRNPQAQMTAGLLYDRLGQEKEADSHFSRAVSLAPKNPEILNNYAVFLCQKNKTEQGIKYALQAAHDPLYRTPDAAYMNAAFCARGAGNKADAGKYFRQALTVSPRSPDALYQLADLEYENGNTLAARAFIERYIETAPLGPTILLLASRIERQLGNDSGADNYARRLRSEFPQSPEAKQLAEAGKTAR